MCVPALAQGFDLILENGFMGAAIRELCCVAVAAVGPVPVELVWSPHQRRTATLTAKVVLVVDLPHRLSSTTPPPICVNLPPLIIVAGGEAAPQPDQTGPAAYRSRTWA
jgi:hypothetical protein